MSSGWNANTFQRRIADPTNRRRWAAGSPNPSEIDAYLAAVPPEHPRKIAVVLGMTPELRNGVLAQFDSVVSIDRSPDAHALYTDWVPADLLGRERRVLGDWQTVAQELHGRVDAVFGDGVFGNCRDTAEVVALLGALRGMLANHGTLVTRHFCYPDHFAGITRNWQELAARFAAGTIDSEGVGFALRCTAFVDRHWNPTTCMIDCVAVYDQLRDLHAAGHLSQELWDYSLRYHFAGANWVPDEHRWQNMLRHGGWQCQRRELVGKDWYRYYAIYRCTLTD